MNRRAHLCQKFDGLHDGAHPLRATFSRNCGIQTLETIRIIEGKA